MQQEQKKSEPQTESRNLHHEDLALKTAAQYFGEELMPLLGITGKAKYVAPTELIKLEARQMYQDFNYVSADNTWIHLEFESDSITTEDLRRFREYEATTSRTYQVQVITYVICSSQVRKPITKLTEGISIYRIKAVRLKGRNSDRLFALLEAKDVRTSDDWRKNRKKPAFSPILPKCRNENGTGKNAGRNVYVGA